MTEVKRGKAKLLTPSKLACGFDGVWQIDPDHTPILWIIDIDSIKVVPGNTKGPFRMNTIP